MSTEQLKKSTASAIKPSETTTVFAKNQTIGVCFFFLGSMLMCSFMHTGILS